MDDINYKEEFAIPLHAVKELLSDGQVQQAVMQAGWIILSGHKWGFLLNTDSLTEAYQGVLTQRWKTLLRTEFFINIVEKFSYYFENEKTKGEEIQKREVPNTDCDAPIPDWYIPFNDQLFVH